LAKQVFGPKQNPKLNSPEKLSLREVVESYGNTLLRNKGARMKLKILATLALAMGFAQNANAQSGNCYNLELIAQTTKRVSGNENNGHRIFLTLGGNTKIGLQEGPFGVVDYNGTDGSASFRLPNPDPTNSGITGYSVFMRLVGKPGSGIDMNTCAYDALGALYCSEASVIMSRSTGGSKFTNVSRELLYIYADIDLDGDIDRVPLFSDQLQDYYWDVDSTGRAHAQLRFCPVSTNVN
jgi:hypothetical protein